MVPPSKHYVEIAVPTLRDMPPSIAATTVLAYPPSCAVVVALAILPPRMDCTSYLLKDVIVSCMTMKIARLPSMLSN